MWFRAQTLKQKSGRWGGDHYPYYQRAILSLIMMQNQVSELFLKLFDNFRIYWGFFCELVIYLFLIILDFKNNALVEHSILDLKFCFYILQRFLYSISFIYSNLLRKVTPWRDLKLLNQLLSASWRFLPAKEFP